MRNTRPLEDSAGTAVAERQAERTAFPYTLGDIDKQANISMYYGFTPIKAPEISKLDMAKAKSFATHKTSEASNGSAKEGRPQIKPSWNAEEKIALLRTFTEGGLRSLPSATSPAMIFYRKPFPGSGLRRSAREVHCGMDILGTPISIGEALIIQTAHSILKDEGFGSLIVELNSVGDKDSIAKHERELMNYFRKHAGSLSSKHRAAFKCNPWSILSSADPECQSFSEGAPKSVSFLGESGRRHFMEVLEFLETLDIPYRINHSLLGNPHFSSHVIFEIKHLDGEKEATLAIGSRYNHLSKKIGFKNDLPAIGVSINYRRPSAETEFKPIGRPKFYFVQFGSDARRKSLKVIEMLQRERIAVYHSLTMDKLVPQISSAEKLKIPYIIIMGQKEAIDGTAVVRNITTREQETVDIAQLAFYLKKLR